MATKITETLRWKNLTTVYSFMEVSIGGQKIMPFAEALKDGSIKALIQDCADSMHDGNTMPVIKQLIENCQSKQCTDKDRVKNTVQVQSEKAVALFKDYLMDMRDESAGKSVRASKAKWAYTCDELDAVTDVATMTKIINCMASHKSKDLSEAYELTDADKQFLEVYAYARKLLKTMKEEASKVSVDNDLLAKLSKGSKATLSAAEAKELYELLAKLNK